MPKFHSWHLLFLSQYIVLLEHIYLYCNLDLLVCCVFALYLTQAQVDYPLFLLFRSIDWIDVGISHILLVPGQ